MKVLCDVHIPYGLVNFFLDKGIDAIHVNTILQKWNTKDADISRYADESDFILITKDSDFRDSFLIQKTPRKPIRVTLGNTSNNDLIKAFENHLEMLKGNYSKEFFILNLIKILQW